MLYRLESRLTANPGLRGKAISLVIGTQEL